MLILAGVSINAIVGDNGILSQATSAKESMEEAELWEQIQMILVEAYGSEKEGQEFVDYVNELFEKNGISDYAILRLSDEGYCLIYGKNKTTIAYLDYDFNVTKTLAAVVGDSSIWILRTDDEGNVVQNEDGTVIIDAYKGSDTEVTIPNVIDGYVVSTLGTQIFMYSGVTSVTFSEGLTTIESKAFSNCGSLTTISNFPDTLITIGEYAFYGCSNLSSTITFTSSMKSVEQYAFYNCSSMNGTVENLIRTSVSYGLNAFYGCASLSGDVSTAMSAFLTEDDTEIPDYLFSGWSGLTGTVTIGSNIERIGQYAFYGCSGITGIDISKASSLEEIGDYAFYNCTSMGTNTSYSQLDFSGYCSNLSTIGEYSFSGSYLEVKGTKVTTLTIPSSITNIGKNAFQCCTALTSVTFEKEFSLTTLPTYMFYKCTSLTSVTIPNTITTIDEYCFYGCTALTTVNYSSNLTFIGGNAFYECTKLTTLPINSDSKLIASLTTISASAFYNCSVLGKISETEGTDIIDLLENSYVTSLGDNAFYGCGYLYGTIADSTVYNATGTVEISQGGGVFTGTAVESGRTFALANSTEVADSEFQGTTIFVSTGSGGEEITEIEIPDTVTTIGDYAFSGCTSITKVIIPYTVTSIGKYAFYGCTALVEVVGYDGASETEEISGVTSLGSYCFAYCTNLEEAGTFSSVTSIPSYCWNHCSSLKTFQFSEYLTSVGGYAFAYCSLTSLDLPSDGSIRLGEYAFDYCNFTTVALPDSVTYLGDMCFENNKSLTCFSCSSSLKSTGKSVFKQCDKLSSVDLGGSLSYIDYYYFQLCLSLSSVSGLGSLTTIGQTSFVDCSSLTLTGLSDLQWEQLTSIESGAFSGCTSLSGTITLSSSCTVSSSAFSGLTVTRSTDSSGNILLTLGTN